MNSKIRKVTENDRSSMLELMRTFYASPAVSTNGSEEIFNANIDACIHNSAYFEGYIFEDETGIQGYALIAKSFSAEFGKPCIWIEDLYIKDQYRGQGIGSYFLKYIESKFPNTLLRLEVETDNQHALHVYKKSGFTFLPYAEMMKQADIPHELSDQP